MSTPLLSFVAIFKDEVKTVRRTLESVRSYVDHATILDTGSTDGTQDVIREVMAGIEISLFEEPFINFAASRNRVLDLDLCEWAASIPIQRRVAVFTVMLSADEVLEGGDALRTFLESKRDAADGAYCVEMRADTKRWLYPRVLRTTSGWRYVGDPHEIPEGPRGERIGPTIPGVAVIHTDSDPARKFRRLREYDLPRLVKRASDESHSAEERAQAIWFLAQTHEALANEHPAQVPGGPWLEHKLTALSLYQKRAELGDDPFKASYAFLCALKVADQIGFLYTAEELLQRLAIVLEMNPKLPEAHYMAAAVAARVDARRGLFLAEAAARVAREAAEAAAARDQTIYLPTDTRMEWLSLEVAIECARALKNDKRAKELVYRALAAGAPKDRFEAHL